MKLTNVINNRRVKKVFCVFALILVMACVLTPITCFATSPSPSSGGVDLNFAENAATTILDNIFWIVLIVAGILLAGAFLKRNIVGAIITVLSAGIICIFLKNPELISGIGEAFGKVIGLS